MEDISMRNRATIPLPNPGEGGPVFTPPGGSAGSLLPNPGEGGPVGPGPISPVIPLPNPSEGGPVGPNRPSILPVPPVANPPCYYCGAGRTGRVRFLGAAYGYQPFRVYINNYFVVNGLGFSSLTGYGRVASGFQTITVTSPSGYVYLQKSVPIPADQPTTIAIINSATGLDLMAISDTQCQRPAGYSCFRVCNLAYSSNPLDVLLADGRVVYSDVRFKEVTSFKRVRPGEYQMYLAETNLVQPRFTDIETEGASVIFEPPQALLSFYLRVRPNVMYTTYILSRDASPESLLTFIVEDT